MTDYKIFLDTNILIYVTLSDIDENKTMKSLTKLKKLKEDGYTFYFSTQIIREFFAVTTGAKYLKKPLLPEEANEQIRDFRSKFELKIIDEKSLDILGDITETYHIKGQKIHDTTIVAVMKRYGINKILTFNEKDFKIFNEIKVESLD